MLLGSLVIFAFIFLIWVIGEWLLNKDSNRNTLLGFGLSVFAGVGSYIIMAVTAV